eukprot:TCALIF_12204-PA protein Name:"Similar to chst14 Carbohydrate sulfotransferase 14 (Danio rerio)" AED:0.05 eAED:0.05 QI:537/0.5/0.66/1/0/0/3/0/154
MEHLRILVFLVTSDYIQGKSSTNTTLIYLSCLCDIHLRDKINSTRDEQFTSWRKKFTKTYGDLSFNSFIQHVLYEFESSCSLADCKVNHHWQPFYDQCGFCNVSFDVIGTLDEFQSDMIYIQERLHRPNIFNLTIRANSALQTSQESTIREKTL